LQNERVLKSRMQKLPMRERILSISINRHANMSENTLTSAQEIQRDQFLRTATNMVYDDSGSYWLKKMIFPGNK
jgi:hypothetical protein